MPLDILAIRSARIRLRWRRLADRLSTLALSLILALAVWLIAINQENPLVRADFQQRVPVTVRNLAPELQPLQDLSKETVQVMIQAPRSSWDNLDVGDFTAYIDLAGLSEGIYDVGVNVEVVDPRVRVQAVQRPELRVQLDPVVTKAVPVRVDIMDTPAYGYDWQPPILEPLTVTVTGPATQINQVASAKAEIFLRGAKSQVERTQAVLAQNAQGQPVPRIDMVPSNVHVIIPVEPWPGRKEVAVRVNLAGQPSAGYRLNTVRVNPPTVVLSGSADVLAEVPGYIETEPFSLAGAGGDIQRQLQLLVPEGVTVLDVGTVNVTASIAAIEGGTTVRQGPVVQGLANGLVARTALETVDVILGGPLPLLESLELDDIFVILDLTGLLPGNHIVTPRVVVPTGIRPQGVLPASVEVVITAAPTPTPDFTAVQPESPLAAPVPTETPAVTLSGTVTPTETPAPLNGVQVTATPMPDD
jgi:YbbR domain-containing protein